jgi:hypothetical protein
LRLGKDGSLSILPNIKNVKAQLASATVR